MAKIYPDLKRLFDNLGKGRKSTYSPDEIKQEFKLYIQDLQTNDIEVKTIYQAQSRGGDEDNQQTQRAQVRTQRFSRPPSEEDFVCRWLGMSRDWWYKLPKGKNGKAYEEVQERIKNYIYKVKYDGAAVGIYNHAIIARDLGLKEQVETTHKNKYESMTDEELQAELKRLEKATE